MKLCLSQRNFAVLLGVTPNSIYYWESGKIEPKEAQKRKIAAIRDAGKRELAKLMAEKNIVIKLKAREKSGETENEQKEKDGTYIVSVKVKPITLFTDTYDLFLSRAEQYAKEVTDHVTKGAQMPTDEEMQEKIYQIYYEVLKEQAEVGMLYGRAEDVVLHIEKEGRGNYGIRQKDMKKLDGLLIEEVHPIE